MNNSNNPVKVTPTQADFPAVYNDPGVEGVKFAPSSGAANKANQNPSLAVPGEVYEFVQPQVLAGLPLPVPPTPFLIYGITVDPTKPTLGQVLTATGPNGANWQTPSGGSGGISGSIAVNQIAFGTNSNTIGGSANFTWNAGVFSATTLGWTVTDSSSGGIFLEETGTGGASIEDTGNGGITLFENGTGGLVITSRSASGTPGNLRIQEGLTGQNGGLLQIYSEGTGADIDIQNTDTSGSSQGINITSQSSTGGGINIVDTGANGVFIHGSGSGGVFIQANSGAGGLTLTTASGTGPLALVTNNTGHLTINGLTGVTHASSDFTAFTFTEGILTAATASSDERLKKDLKPFTPGLAAILKINPITYWWNELSGIKSDHEWVGFSAQNVREVIPVATPLDPQTGYLEFNDKGLIAALVNAVKELNAETQALRAIITGLQGLA